MNKEDRYLFKNLSLFRERLHTKPTLFFDYDGTLTPIVARPERAYMSYDIHELLKILTRFYRIVVISGRTLKDVMERVDIENIIYAGNHGMEIYSKWFTMVYDFGGTVKILLKRLCEEMKTLAGRYRGAIVEDKGFTLSLHYRLVDIREAERLVKDARAILKPFEDRGQIRITGGKKVLEVRPPSTWNKGSAVRWLMERPLLKGTIPLYVGDDVTDIDAFMAIGNGGITISVGKMQDVAHFYLKSQAEVKKLMGYLKEIAERREFEE